MRGPPVNGRHGLRVEGTHAPAQCLLHVSLQLRLLLLHLFHLVVAVGGVWVKGMPVVSIS